MKTFIFAAGKGKRMRPFTDSAPKPLIKVSHTPIIRRLFSSLPDGIVEAYVVVGYKEKMIREYLGETCEGKPITYIEQEELLGTGHALGLCRSYVDEGEKFLVVYADNLYNKDDLTRLVSGDAAMLVRSVPNAAQGVVTIDEKDNVVEIVEWPKVPTSNLVVTGAYFLDSTVWNYTPRLRENGEYYINDMLQGLIDKHGMRAEYASFWMPVGTPDERARAEEFFRKKDDA